MVPMKVSLQLAHCRYLKSAGEALKHFTVADTFDPLFNWGQRVDNASTIIQGYLNGNGAQFSYHQDTGAVSVNQNRASQA